MSGNGIASGIATFRACAVAAVVGGALRAMDSFTLGLPAGPLAMLYALTDLLILAGIAGIWSHRRPTRDTAAKVGLVLAVVGTLAIRIAAFGLLGDQGYQLAAVVELVGLAVYGVDTLVRQAAAPVAPGLWIAALVCALASAAVAPAALTAAAGVLFGAAFIAAGVEMLRA